MITLFTTTKDFTGIYKTIQMNALKSWRSISNDIEIIIFGDSKGSKEAAEEVGSEYIPNVKCSDQGTPFLSDLFQQADKKAKYSILTYINADIILPINFFDDVLAARAFKPLKIILQLIHNKAKNWKKIFIFLGKTGKSELLQASKSWDIEYKQRVSVTSNDSIVIEINRLKKK